jgi:hypothetical protein
VFARASAPDLATWSDVALCDEVRERAEAVERAQAELVAATGIWLERQAWRSESGLSANEWLAQHTPMTRATAARLCATARLVQRNEQTAKALDVGDVSTAHVEVLAFAARRRDELYAEHEDTLLDVARSLTPDDLVTAARQWRELADDQLSAADAAAVHDARFVQLSPTTGGGVLDGFLDADATATVLDAFDALVPPDPAGTPDPRPRSVRHADALVMLAEQWLGDRERAGRREVALQVVVDLDVLLRRAGLESHDVRCELRDHGPISRATLERLMCDAKVARIVMAGRSRVLDLGRSTAVVSPALRQAVMLRDRHCQHPGCRAPAKWCDVHHIVSWPFGPTDLDNLVLLCRRHHVDHHEGAWQITRAPDGTISAAPSTTQPFLRRRRHRRR